MRDNKPMEMIAEHLIAHVLQRHKFLVTKPYFDRDAGDLYAMTDEAGDRFCRIQCKGRKVQPGRGGGSNVEIDCSYVRDRMVVFLYVDDGSFAAFNLFVFFKEDVETWKKAKRKTIDIYRLSLSHSTFAKNLKKYAVNEAGLERLANEIMSAKPPKTSVYRYTGTGGPSLAGVAIIDSTGKVPTKKAMKKAKKKATKKGK